MLYQIAYTGYQNIYDKESVMPPKTIQKRIERIKKNLLKIGEMRPGSLSKQYSACEKEGCKCIDPVNPQKHGPYYQLSYVRKGKSTTRFIRPAFVRDIERQLANYKKFKSLTDEWVGLAFQYSTLKLESLRKMKSD
jgi:hypothetical protein